MIDIAIAGLDRQGGGRERALGLAGNSRVHLAEQGHRLRRRDAHTRRADVQFARVRRGNEVSPGFGAGV